ncbi:MAG: divalent-cation tolerance protein CutA [Verrucomicrobia bacterium]|nr:divalent-cation tolerance protein CutA [Verrucomicrobiota bacterium]MBU1734402.1 divalent-cation tolerance protein CutA [Verrucomicrobiota bacterium]MBU1855690.1 divalent-cation tolerance protein CutA [Verrucomicrobiota bacterium]
MHSTALSIVQTTVASRREARRLAGLIVKERLAACVQITPIHSTYRWQNKVEQATEWLLAAKTRSARTKALMAFIRRHHPYEVPEIMAMSITQVLPAYRQWVLRETKAIKRLRDGKGRG